MESRDETLSRQAVRIGRDSATVPLNVRELWDYRELLYFFIWRDLKVRYKQTILGIIWAVIQPLSLMAVFTLFFGRLIGVPSDGLPYSVFVLTGLLPWQLFAYSLTESSNSVVANYNLITKTYFPRIIIPIASTLAGIVDFGFACLFLLILMGVYQIMPTTSLWALPLLVLLTLLTAVGVGLWLAALNARYRDVRYCLPFLVQLWFFATPIAYPASLVPPLWRPILGLNPMAGAVEGFRWAVLGTGSAIGSMLLVSTVVAMGLFVWGTYYFCRREADFADSV